MDVQMILSASGWRRVFAASGGEQDRTAEIGTENTARAVFAAEVFSDFVRERTGKNAPLVICGTDSRPTGAAIADAVLRTLSAKGASVKFLGISAAPEIMAYAKSADGFIYISASHNPIGHNGIKFGLNSGGVLNAEENALLSERFRALCEEDGAVESALRTAAKADDETLAKIYESSAAAKKDAAAAYRAFLRRSISGTEDEAIQEGLFAKIKAAAAGRNIGVVCDMNGSARTLSVDADFFRENGIRFYPINDRPGEIVHEIIPESENLVHCAKEMERLQGEGNADAVIGYMPDCDGDRGNIVYWDSEGRKAEILKAQEVFALSVLAELSYACWQKGGAQGFSPAVAVNCPTSMRIDEIAFAFGARVFRAEVGEANVVSLAEALRKKGFSVPLCGEGSNGGTITWPSAVRDPMNTVFAIIKLLSIPELLERWCAARSVPFRPNFTLSRLLGTLPPYTTTGVSEPRALLHIKTSDHALLKARFQKIFEREYSENLQTIREKYGITSYEAVCTNGTVEARNSQDFSKSGRGGLKIIFYSEDGGEKRPAAFFWMRGSGTEPVFRILCDVAGRRPDMERALLEWETKMLLEADSQ